MLFWKKRQLIRKVFLEEYIKKSISEEDIIYKNASLDDLPKTLILFSSFVVASHLLCVCYVISSLRKPWITKLNF